jgi:hypothetical protein
MEIAIVDETEGSVGIAETPTEEDAATDFGGEEDAATGAVLKSGGMETPLFRAQVAGSSPSGQQKPCVRQNEPPGQPSANASVCCFTRLLSIVFWH